jgi:cell division protein FtsX
MKLKVYLTIVLVFLLGLLSGGILVMQYIQSKAETLTRSSTIEVYQLILDRLDKKLDLTDSQHEKISEILEGAAYEIEPLRNEFRSKVLSLLRKNSVKINDELNTEQKEYFEKLVNSIIKKLNLE